MPPRSKEIIIFVLNVGTSNLAFLRKAKYTVRRLIEKKIFLRPKTDEIGLILMGSTLTKNKYAVDNVEVLDITAPTWDLVRAATNTEGTDKTTVSWADALYVAADYIAEECVDASARMIILFSDVLDAQRSKIKTQFDLGQTVGLLKEKNIGFVCVGEGSLDLMSSEPAPADLAAIRDFCREVNGQYLTIDRAVDDVKIFKRNWPNPTAWKCNMDVYGITIPIASYIKVAEEAKLPPWTLITEEQPGLSVKITRRRELLDKHRTERSAENAVAGYVYGGEPIPFSDEHESAMAYRSGAKSYRVHSFVERSEIGLENWHGEGTRLILPANDSTAAKLFYTMMRAMNDRGLVAVVRKVFKNDSPPKIVVLFPRADVAGEPWCFIEIELPFSEDRNAIESRPTKSILGRLTKEQGRLVDDMLTSFALDKDEAGEDEMIDGTSFLPGCVANPAAQHRWNALAARAIAPGHPLPPIDNSLLALLKRPACIRAKSEEHLDRIKRSFNLN